MKTWADRPIEIRNLFNPAFCGIVLFRGLAAYHLEDDRGMPFSLSLLILPLCLQQASREIIRAGHKSYFLKIVADHPELLVDFGRRCTDVLPFTLEALGVLMHVGALSTTSKGGLVPHWDGVRKTVSGSDESVACQRAASFLGKHFARIGDRATIYSTLGVRP